MIIPPKRGFEVSEYENRLDNIQKLMLESRMDAILLTTQVDIEYYSSTLFTYNITFMIIILTGDSP